MTNFILSVKQAHERDLLGRANVVGVGVGEKKRRGRGTGQVAVTVLVTRKMSAVSLDPNDMVPERVSGVPTDVVETGPIHALGFSGYRRPVAPGFSIGHEHITAGTFGCVVELDGEKHILSNNHVMANSNRAQHGDPILQPGPYDGGTEKVAELSSFKAISFTTPECPIATTVTSVINVLAGRRRHYIEAKQDVTNHVDAALARPINEGIITKEIARIGAPTGVSKALLGLPVQKSGRTTGYQRGRVSQLHATVSVNYGRGKVGMFTDQVIIESTTDEQFSAGGDSGSAILDMDNHVVGLLFAGSDKITIANPIRDVLSCFGAQVVC